MRLGKVFALGCVAFHSKAIATPGNFSETSCCHALQTEFSNDTYIISPIPTIDYLATLNSYFSNTNKLAASCFVRPGSAAEVSRVVSILSRGKCQFAVRGGGAATVPGASDIDNGVTIDLSRLSNVTLSPDKKSVAVQGGAQWGQVYAALDPEGYTVPGAIGPNSGVGGLTLGGGMNNYMSRYGWTFDLVQDFEIVLGNGTIANASPERNSDLFKALKGGGQGNFGIVTKFEFSPVKTGPIWGGVTVYGIKDISKLYKPFVDTIDQSTEQPDVGYLLAWTNNATTGETTAGTYVQYTGNTTGQNYYTHTEKPTSKGLFPEAWSAFSFDKVGIPTFNTLRIDSTVNFAHELTAGSDQRQLISNVMIKADIQILANVDRIAQKALSPYLNQTSPHPYDHVQIEYQPFPRLITNISDKHGGNVLGLERVQSNAIQFAIWFTWADPTQDALIQNLTTTILREVTKYTKSVPGAFVDFQYVGLAAANQDPIGSYGLQNIEYLKRVSQKYDPGQVFQKLVPGGFKLGDAGSKEKKAFNFNQFSNKGTN